jgi:ribosome biogenesis GTPase A
VLLTDKMLNEYLYWRRINIPEKLKKNILEEYGQPFEDEQGHIVEYGEQDIAEQIRKIIQNYQEKGVIWTKL